MALSARDIPIEDKATFLSLANQLSPENLHADGERSRSDARKLMLSLKSQWRALEMKHGVRVPEHRVRQWFGEDVRQRQASDRFQEWFWEDVRQARELAASACPQNQLVRVRKAGVWIREGQTGTAYYVWGPQHTGSKFQLFSEFAHRFGARERIGDYDSLDKAVEAGEAFLATVNADFILAKFPDFRPEHIKNELMRLPMDFKVALPVVPPVTGFRVHLGGSVITVLTANEVGKIIEQNLTERGKTITVEAVG